MLLIPFALDAGGRSTSPAEAQPQVDYRCCDCGELVRLRRESTTANRRRHFAHARAEADTSCNLTSGGPETREHALAKTLVAHALERSIESEVNKQVSVWRTCPRCQAVHNVPVSAGLRKMGAKTVKVEARSSDAHERQFLADVGVFNDAGAPLLLIEVRQTHAVTTTKATTLATRWFELGANDVLVDAHEWHPLRDGPTTPIRCSCEGLAKLLIPIVAGAVDCKLVQQRVPASRCNSCEHHRSIPPFSTRIRGPQRVACGIPASAIEDGRRRRADAEREATVRRLRKERQERRRELRQECEESWAEDEFMSALRFKRFPMLAGLPLSFAFFLALLRKSQAEHAAEQQRRRQKARDTERRIAQLTRDFQRFWDDEPVTVRRLVEGERVGLGQLWGDGIDVVDCPKGIPTRRSVTGPFGCVGCAHAPFFLGNERRPTHVLCGYEQERTFALQLKKPFADSRRDQVVSAAHFDGAPAARLELEALRASLEADDEVMPEKEALVDEWA